MPAGVSCRPPGRVLTPFAVPTGTKAAGVGPTQLPSATTPPSPAAVSPAPPPPLPPPHPHATAQLASTRAAWRSCRNRRTIVAPFEDAGRAMPARPQVYAPLSKPTRQTFVRARQSSSGNAEGAPRVATPKLSLHHGSTERPMSDHSNPYGPPTAASVEPSVVLRRLRWPS